MRPVQIVLGVTGWVHGNGPRRRLATPQRSAKRKYNENWTKNRHSSKRVTH